MDGSEYLEPRSPAPRFASPKVSGGLARLEVLLVVRSLRDAALAVTDMSAVALAERTGHSLEVVFSALDSIRHQEAPLD